MKLKTIKLSEENLCNLGFLGKDFLAITAEQTDKLHFFQILKCQCFEKTSHRLEENICKTYILYRTCIQNTKRTHKTHE